MATLSEPGTKKKETEGTENGQEPDLKKARVVTTEKMPESFAFSSGLSLEDIRRRQEEFADDRNWNQFHSPRNLLLALVGEVGELSECFQWKGEVQQGLTEWTEKEKEHVGEELSDVLIYLVRLADKCDIDLPSAVVRKFELNAKKYPPNMVKGSSKKYSEYKVVDNKLSTSEDPV